MYQALLTRRYMTSKVMPLLSIVAVLLCSAMVLVTWSVMGGFLTMLVNVGRDMEGDVTIAWPVTGFAHYEELIARVEADPMVKAAAPVIETFGMVSLPDDRLKGVQIKGIDERYARVTTYAESLWWKPLDKPMPKDKARVDPRLVEHEAYKQIQANGMALTIPDRDTGKTRPAVVPGIEMGGFSMREPTGVYRFDHRIGKRTVTGGTEWVDGLIVGKFVTLNVLPVDRKGRVVSSVSRRLPVANEFRTGLYEADQSTILIRLDELQRMLLMDEAERLEDAPLNLYGTEKDANGQEGAATPKVIGIEPARVTGVVVKANDGIDSEVLRSRCLEIYDEFAGAHAGEVPTLASMIQGRSITTFERSRAMFIAQVKKETALVLSLLLFISFVAVFLILAIFWAMVSEKTKDIGVLRSIGASKAGVAWLWLRYGMVIGIAGAVLGSVLAYTVVWNINPIHEWMGNALGIEIWNQNVYYFAEIPNKVVPERAALVLFGGIAFSVLGALIPAIKAAWMDPVRALRFE